MTVLIYGINPVAEALRAGRVTALRVARRADGRLARVLALARARNVPVRTVDTATLDRETSRGVHQGVVADLRPADDATVVDLVKHARGVPLIVVLDGIEDPHNVGAIIRSAEAAGAAGVIRQQRRSATLSGAAAKASAGAIAHLTIATVVNIARAVDELKALGVWTVGLTGDAPTRYDRLDLTLPTAFVLGAEDTGLRRLVREKCDVLASIPMHGHVGSLNVSVAAGVVLFEALRQRSCA